MDHRVFEKPSGAGFVERLDIVRGQARLDAARHFPETERVALLQLHRDPVAIRKAEVELPDLALDLFPEIGLFLRSARAGVEDEEDAVSEVREDISPPRHHIRHGVGHIADEVEIGGRPAPAVDRVNVGDLEGGEFRALCAAFAEALHQVLERVVVQVAGHVVDIERVADLLYRS